MPDESRVASIVGRARGGRRGVREQARNKLEARCRDRASRRRALLWARQGPGEGDGGAWLSQESREALRVSAPERRGRWVRSGSREGGGLPAGRARTVIGPGARTAILVAPPWEWPAQLTDASPSPGLNIGSRPSHSPKGVRRKASSRHGPDASEHKLTICASWLRINADVADGPASHGRTICSISFTEHLASLAGARRGT